MIIIEQNSHQSTPTVRPIITWELIMNGTEPTKKYHLYLAASLFSRAEQAFNLSVQLIKYSWLCGWPRHPGRPYGFFVD